MLNISSHPSSKWQQTQLEAANNNVTDLPAELQSRFSQVDPGTSVGPLAQNIVDWAKSTGDSVAMVQGDARLTVARVGRLTAAGITCVAGCTRRESVETVMPDGSLKKTQIFNFCGFMPYEA